MTLAISFDLFHLKMQILIRLIKQSIKMKVDIEIQKSKLTE